MKKLKVGIDNYGLSPLGLTPLQILQWAKDNGAEGVHFSGLIPEEKHKADPSYLKDLSQFAASHHLYLEWGGGQHIPFDMETWEKKEIFDVNRKAASEAEILGTRVVRSCSGGLMRWNPASPKLDILLDETASTLRSQREMLQDHNVILAIETHFEFTTFELLRLFDMCKTEPGEYLGICLDTMNLLTMLEEPVQAVERILPWIVCTHVKDGGVILGSEGLVSFPLEIGKGVVDLRQIIALLKTLPQEVNLSIEDHGGSFSLPVFDPRFLIGFPDLSRDEFIRLVQLAYSTQEKMEHEGLTIVDREKWPEICEERLKKDVLALKGIAST